ncbi:MAG: hypothetical protein QOD03_992, partial [Verrucomicrobiota bacterium]
FAQTKWGGATNIQLHVQSLHSLTNLLPLSGSGELRLADATTDWGRAQQLQLAATLAHSTNTLMDSSWAWWTNFAPFALNWDCRVSGVQSPKLQADEVFCAGQWLAPELKIDKLSAKLYRGTLDAKASLDVASREFSFSGASDFDAQKITPLLTPGARKWLSNYSWKTPPSASAEGTLVLPAWTNRQPDWRAEVQPTLRLSGQVHATDCAFRNVPVSTADTHFTYTNMVWRLPDITLTRPEGRMTLFHESNDRTKDYYFKINSAIDPGALRPLFQSNQWHAVELVTFSQPPAISGEIWGRWHDNERLNARAHVAITNFALRGQTASRLEATLEYTNKFLKVIEPRCYRGTQEMSAASVLIDFAGQRAFLTNGFGVVDPLPIARAIGPKIGRHIEPYRFYEPVAIHAEGVIPFRDEKVADLHFIVDGHSFEWWKFRVGHVSGKIDWVGQQLNLRDIVADFYRGTAVGAAEFDFKAKPGAEFSFNLVATDADIHLLAADLTGKTNKLEGRLTTRLDITRCYTTNWQNSVQGNGRANLRDGLIWDIPIFGIFSPVLDTIMPGLGNSRAREGSATFSIKNGVARSNDLEIQTMMARLQYHGTIDLQGNVNAYVEAEPLRNTWVVGPVISLALWPVSKAFEYKISGTLHKPESEPLFIPKFMFMPFHPVKTIKDLLPEDSNPQTETPSESP